MERICGDACRVCGLVPIAPGLSGTTQVIVRSDAMQAVLKRASRFAASDAPVAVLGETGTGKEVVARIVHANSPRAARPFVAINVAALPADLLESELFGHGKGAFTGAATARHGLFEAADGGTLFLDEIGDMPLALQAKLLRALQDGEIRRVRESQSFSVDVRVVCATHRDLALRVRDGAFREDLLYRLRTIVLTLPPLRARQEDIKSLTIHHMNRLCERYRLPTKGFAEEFFQALCVYSWPGNVRELFGAMERVLLQYRNEPVLYPKHLPDEIRLQVLRANGVGEAAEPGYGDTVESDGAGIAPWKAFRRLAMEEVERGYLGDLLQISRGNVGRASKISGLSPSRLYDLFRKYGLVTRP